MSKNFFKDLSTNFNINLNSQQKKAVLHKEGPAVVLAVPGSGKTTVLISRTANLILNHNVNPKNILSVTFSKASTKDMKNRFDSIFGNYIKSNVYFSTIHSFSYSLIRYYSRINNINYTLIEGRNSPISKIKLLKDIYRQVNNSIINDDKLEELLNSLGYVNNMLIKEENFSDYKFSDIKGFKDIYRKYKNFKTENNYIDFDDMLTLSIEILQNNPLILSNIRTKYQYIQVDEGQDTSKAQNEIIRLLAQPRNNLFIVADDDQSIYGFRGANPEYLLNFDKFYKNNKTFFMEQNYRSTSNIVETANEFIKINSMRYNKNLFTKNDSNMPITIGKFKDELKQYEYLIDSLKSLDSYEDTAILYRNNISSISIINSLIENNIPFYVRDSKNNFFNHWVIRDLKAFINLAYDNTDIYSFEKIYYKMNGYISKAQIKYIKNKDSSKTVFERLLNFPDIKFYQKNNIRRIKDKFNFLTKLNAKDFIDCILYDLEYDEYLRKNSKKFGLSYENIKIILSTIKYISKDLSNPLEIFDKLDYIYKEIKNNRGYDSNKIRLSTLHSSKGLEFDKVFIVDLIDHDFPSSSSIEAYETGDKKPLEEERRLFYVGITRAKKQLTLTTYKERDSDKVYQSMFISELEKIMAVENNEYGINYGDKIHHKSFGHGKVIEIEDDMITIDFNMYGKKKISLKISMENNLLKVV